MKFFKKVFGLAALVAVGGGIFGASAASLNKEGEWSTTVKVSRGQEHTFWITGLTADSAVFSLDVSGAYKYKEDGETWEDEVWPFESCEVENASGGWDKYVLLTADDWDGVPESVKSVTFTVYASGFYDEEVKANNNFTFGHAAGRDAYPGSIDPPVPPTPVGEADNPLTFSLKTLTANDPNPGKLDVTAADEFEGPVYYIKTASLVAGQKYRFGYSGSSSISNFTMSASLAGTDDLFTTEGIGKAYPDWEACSQAFEVVPTVGGVYYIRLEGVGAGDMFSFYHAGLPTLTPAKHLPTSEFDLAVGAVSSAFRPGYMNDPASYAYDEVIDQQLFRITGYDKGENLVFRTEGADSDLIMRLYDSKGTVLAENFTVGGGSKDCQIAWTTTAKYVKTSETTILYLGVCQKLADGEEPTAGPVTLSVERVDLVDEATAVTAVPDKTDGDPRTAEDVIPSDARSFGSTMWANTFTLAARGGVTYKLKARLAETGLDNGLAIWATAYTLSGKTRTILKDAANQKIEKSDLIDPKSNGFLTITPTAHGTVYVEVSVADGECGVGKGLDYGSYEICATAAGDYGILQVPMAGATQELMGWKILSGPGITASKEPYYPAGAGAIVPAGKYKVAAQQVKDYEKVEANGFAEVEVKAGTAPSTPEALYKYRDTFDLATPNDDAWDKKPTELKPTATKPVEVVRSLWKDDGKGGSDPADWYFVKPTGDGAYYRFDLKATAGMPRIDVFGPDSTNTVCKGVPTEAFDNVYLLKQISTEKNAKYYVRVTRELDADDNSYVLTASTATPGQIKLTKTEYSVKDGTAYVDVGVSRTGKDGSVMLRYRTEADTAKPGTEYYPVCGTNVWLNGDQKEQKIRINLIPDLVSKWFADKSFKLVFETFADDGTHAFADDEYIPTFQVTSKTTGTGANRVTTVTTNDTVTIKITPAGKKTPGTIQLADCDNPKKPVIAVVAGETAEIALERVIGTNGLVGVSVVSVKGTANKNGEGIDYETINIPELTWADGASGKSETIRIVTKKTDGDFTGTKTFTLKLTALKTNTKKNPDGSLVDPRVFDNPTIASQTITVNIVNDKYTENVTDFAKTFPKGSAVQMKEGKKDSWFKGEDGEFYSIVSRKFTGPARLWWGPSDDPYRTNCFISAKAETITMRSDDVYTNDLLQAATAAAPTADKAVLAAGEVKLSFDKLPDDEAREIGYRVYVLEQGAKAVRQAGKPAVTLKLGDPETEIPPPYVTNVAWRSTSQNGKYTWRVDTFFKGGTVTNTARTAWAFTVLKDAEAGAPLKVDGQDDVYSDDLELGVPYELQVAGADAEVKSFTAVSGTKPPDGLKLEQDKGTVQNPGSMNWYVRGRPTKPGDFQYVIQATYNGTPATKSPTYVLKFHVAALPDNKTIVANAPTVDKAVLTAGAHNLKFEAGDHYRVFFGKDADKSKFGKDPAFEIFDPPYQVQVEAGVKYAWQVFTFAEGGSVTNKSATFALTGAPTGTLNTAGYETKITGKDAYNADYAEGTVMRLRQRLPVDFLIGNDYAPAKDVEIKSVRVLAGKLPDGLKVPAINTYNARTNPTGDGLWHILGTPTKAGKYQAVIQTTYMEVYERNQQTGKPLPGKAKDFAAATVVMDFVVEAVDASADLSFTLTGPGRLVYTATDARIPEGEPGKTATLTNFISKASETLKLTDLARLHSYEYVKLDAVTPKAPFAADKAVVAAGPTELTYNPLPDDEANGIAYRVYLRDTKKDTKLKLGQPETEVTTQYTNLAENASYEWRVDSYFTDGPVTNTAKTAWKFTTLGKDAAATTVGGTDAFGRMCGTVGNVTYTEQSDVIRLYQGVKANFAVSATTNAVISKVTSVAGKLPDGVKLEQNKYNKTSNPTGDDKWYVRGTPTKAGDFEAIVQVTCKGAGNKDFATTTYLMRFNVRAAGSSIGTFNGLVSSYDSTNFVHHLASVQFTSSAGKLSAKAKIAGKDYSFADTGFARLLGGVADDPTAPVTLQADLLQVQKIKELKPNAQGKLVDTDVSYTNVLHFTVVDVPLTDATYWATNSMAEVQIEMAVLPDLKGTHGQYDLWYDGKTYRDNAKEKDWTAAAEKFAGYYTVALVAADADSLGNEPCGNGYMTLTLDAKGKAKVAGALADGTTYSGSATAAFDLIGDEIAVRIPLYAYKGTSLFGGWFAIRYPKGCVPTTNLAETPLDAVPVAVCEIGDTTLVWKNDDPSVTYFGDYGYDLTLYPVGGWYDTVVDLQRYYRSADFSYNEFEIDTAHGNDFALLEELLKENNEDDYVFVADASANAQTVDLVGDNVSVEKQTLVKKIDPETGKAGKYNDWQNSVNAANVKLTFKRATGIMTGTCDLWYAGYKSDAKGNATYEEKTFANCKHAGVLLLSRDPAQNWLGDTDTAQTWSAGSVVIPQTINYVDEKNAKKSRKWNASFRFNIKATKVNRSWGEQPPYSGD